MTISTTVRKAGPYQGNGLVVTFPFYFKVFSQEDLMVTFTNALGIESVLVFGVDYLVELNTDQENRPGGDVVMAKAPVAGELITISSIMAYKQPVRLTNMGGFYPDVLNNALDRLTIFVQQLAEQVMRAVKVNISSSIDPDDLVAQLVQAAPIAQNAASRAEIAAQTAQEVARELEQGLEDLEDVKEAIVPATPQEIANGTAGKLVDAQGLKGVGYIKTTNTIVMTASGTYTPTPGTKFIIVEGVGGGGAGGGSTTGTVGYISVGAGGGAGGYCKSKIDIADLGDSVEVTVGVGGTGVLGANGGRGGTTAFGTFFSALGGYGGSKAGPSTSSFISGGGGGGAALRGNIVNCQGEAASAGFYSGVALSTSGAISAFGGGGASTYSTTGNSSPSYGAGGGGVAIGAGTGTFAGGNGGAGVVIITEYI